MLRHDPNVPLVFIHVAKTGGTTVRGILRRRFPAEDVLDLKSVDRLNDSLREMSSRYKVVMAHLCWDSIVPRYPSPPNVMTWLRDPVDRFLSHFYFIKQVDVDRAVSDPTLREHTRQIAKMSLEEFLTKEEYVPRDYHENLQTRLLSGQREFLATGTLDPKHLDRAKERLGETAFFGLTGRMFESMLMFSDFVGLPMPEEIPWQNRTRQRQRLDELPQSQQAALREYNRLDLELYHYAEELFEQRWHKWLLRCSDEVYRYQASCHKESLPKSRKVSFHEPFTGSGWHDRSNTTKDGKNYRWSGPGTRSSVDVTLNTESPLRLRFEVLEHYRLDRDLLDSLQLSANSHPVQLEKPYRKEGRITIVEGAVPDAARADADGLLRLVFQVDATRRPVENGRLVGLAFTNVEVFEGEEVLEDSALKDGGNDSRVAA